MESVFVGICGGSGSGKSTMVSGLIEELGVDRVSVLRHDSYYRDRSHLTPAARAAVNFDHPESLDTALLVEHLETLRSGRPVEVPVYDFASHTRGIGNSVTVVPRPTILVDGILILSEPRLRTLLDLAVFVDAPEEVRLHRRLHRDTLERGRTPENVLLQFKESVKPMHDLYVEPSRRHADVIVTGGGASPVARKDVARRILDLTPPGVLAQTRP